MIVNANKTLYVIVELTKADINRILRSKDVYCHSSSYNDEPVLARVYCSDPSAPLETHDEE